jgi:ribosome-binding factor A
MENNDNSRRKRVSALLKEEIGKILLELVKERTDKLITVMDVDLSKDLRFAKVYISIYGDDKNDKEKFIQNLNKNVLGFIKYKLAHILRLKRIPDIKFLLDTSWEESLKIQNIINSLSNR